MEPIRHRADSTVMEAPTLVLTSSLPAAVICKMLLQGLFGKLKLVDLPNRERR